MKAHIHEYLKHHTNFSVILWKNRLLGLRRSSPPKSAFPDLVAEIYGSNWIFYHDPVHTYSLSKGEKCPWNKIGKLCVLGASLVAHGLRIRLLLQGAQVRALVQEDPTCRRATKPAHHNCWAYALEPMSHNYWAHVPWLLKPTHLEPVLRKKRSPPNEKPAHQNEE